MVGSPGIIGERQCLKYKEQIIDGNFWLSEEGYGNMSLMH